MQPGAGMPGSFEAGTHFEPLTPLAFLARSGRVHRNRTAVIDGEQTFTYGELHDRAQRLAAVLARRGVRPGDRVAVLGANSQLLLTAHFACTSWTRCRRRRPARS